MSDAVDAFIRVEDYLARRKIGHGYDVEWIHGFEPSPNGGTALLASDLQALLDTAPAAIVNAARRKQREQNKSET